MTAESSIKVASDMPASVTDQSLAHERLTERLLSGCYAPGRQITVSEAADDLGLGIMPTRYAIRRLCAIGVLERKKNRSVCVPVLTKEQWAESVDLVFVLEKMCIARIISAHSRIDTTELRVVVDNYAQAIDTHDTLAMKLYVSRFWMCLYGMSGSATLFRLLRKTYLRVGPFFALQYEMPSDEQENWSLTRLRHFTGIIDALEQRDEGRLIAALAAMIERHKTWYGSIRAILVA